MAIDLVTFNRLLRYSESISDKSNILILGRQHFLKMPPVNDRMARQMKIYQRMLDDAGKNIALESIIDEDGFSDSFFKALGFDEISYMDISDYEGANIIHDLNKPVPNNLLEKFNLIVDGGTLEHIFNVPVALENLSKMCAADGHIIGFNPCNNWPGHGFYQFGPEIVWSFWRDYANFKIHECSISSMRDWFGKSSVLIAPPETRNMARDYALPKLLGDGIQIMCYHAQKISENASMSSEVQQSDYLSTWRSTET